MRNQYQNLRANVEIEELANWARDVSRNRLFDLEDYNSQVSDNPVVFPVPSNSTDLRGTEKIGDIAADNGFFYIVVSVAGGLEWRRMAISSF